MKRLREKIRFSAQAEKGEDHQHDDDEADEIDYSVHGTHPFLFQRKKNGHLIVFVPAHFPAHNCRTACVLAAGGQKSSAMRRFPKFRPITAGDLRAGGFRAALTGSVCFILLCSTGFGGHDASAAAGSVPESAKNPATVACEVLGDPPVFGRLPVCIAADSYRRDLCDAIDLLARRNTLPSGFFARLLWQESRFDPNAISPKGAEGIAQFMPGTARLRGLHDAFNPADALAKSAAYLSQMARQYGNLGLAAVGYNAGEARAARLLASGADVPFETERYVLEITGLPVGAWTDTKPKTVDYSLDAGKPFIESCLTLANTRRLTTMSPDDGAWKPWGAELGASFSRVVARRIFSKAKAAYPGILGEDRAMMVRKRNLSFGTRARYTVRVGRDTRAEAAKLCSRITAAGGFCLVKHN